MTVAVSVFLVCSLHLPSLDPPSWRKADPSVEAPSLYGNTFTLHNLSTISSYSISTTTFLLRNSRGFHLQKKYISFTKASPIDFRDCTSQVSAKCKVCTIPCLH
jgi:hypothetical protein